MITKKNIIKIAVISVLFLSPFLTAKGFDQEDFLIPAGVSGSSELVGADLLTLLLEVKSIKLDNDVFNNEIFIKLKDFSREIKPQSVGRSNPFSVIGSDAVIVEIEVVDTDLPAIDTN